MSMISEFLSDWVQPVLGGKKYEDWEHESLKLQTVTIKNKTLAKELESACEKNGGFLTYAEYLAVDQFGDNGYHMRNKKHGFTYTHTNWAKAISSYIKLHDIHQIIEIGPGIGILAHELFSLSKKHNFPLKWSGVEVSDPFREHIKHVFRGKKYKDFLGQLVKTISELSNQTDALVIMSYCIDSVAPEIVTNTKSAISTPNAVIGVKIIGDTLSEFILNENDLSKKGIKIIGTTLKIKDSTYDISSWKLAPLQRAYITFESFSMLSEIAQKVENLHLLIIDEVRTETNVYHSDHILSPLYLNVKNRRHFTPRQGYIRSGEMLYYFPFFKETLISVLKSLNLVQIESDIEPRMAAKLSGKNWKANPRFRYLCYGILAHGKPKIPKIVHLEFPPS